MRKLKILVVGFIFLSGGGYRINAESYVIDNIHSRIGFTVKHMMINKVYGQFNTYTGTFEYDTNNLETSKADIKIDVSSINTGIEKRDTHLKSEDFFDVKKYPEISFELSKVEKVSENKFKVTGKMTMHGSTNTISLDVEGGDIIKDSWGNIRTGFSLTGTISRKEFGLTYNSLLETGGMVVADDIHLQIDIEGVQQKQNPDFKK